MSEIEREVLEVDVLIVGAGPAGLGAAIRLAQLAEEQGKDDLMIAVIEKAAEIGFHACSGAIMDPRGIAELIPDYRAKGCPIEADVVSDEVWYLHEQERIAAPFTPKPGQAPLDGSWVRNLLFKTDGDVAHYVLRLIAGWPP